MAIVGEAHVIVRAITTGFEEDVQRGIKRANLAAQGTAAGKTLGTGFSKGFSSTSGLTAIQKQSLGVYQSINRLIERSYYLQAAIGSLGPVLADLVAGLFALGAQAAAAAPALIVFPGILSAVMQAAITAKLALGGVFKAVGELGKAKTKSVDQMPSKLRAFETAQRRVQSAQEALNRAYREAEERLQQLGFDTEDAALAQQRAGLELEDARATLARVQDLPPNSRARQEAELAFKEADLNYRRAIDRSSDLAEEQDRVTKNGTLNAEEQVNQSEEVLRAQRELRDATVSLYDAQKALNEANKSGAGATPEFSKLSKEAQAFAKYLVSLKPEIQALKDAAGKEMFGPMQTGIQNLVDNFLPRLKPLLQETGKAFGNMTLDFSKIVTQEQNLKNFEKVGKTNVDTIGKFGKVAGNLYSVFLSLLSAADPLIRRFTDWVVTLTNGWKATAEAKNQSGKLTGVFNQAGDVAAQFGRIIANLGGAFFNMGKAATGPGSGGQLILDYFEKTSKKFKEFTDVASKDGSLEEYFRTAGENFTKIFDILRKITNAFTGMAGEKGTGGFLDSISRSVDILTPALERLTQGGTSGPFGKFIEQMAQFLASTTESGSIKIYFTLLTKALGALNAVLSNPIVSRLFAIVAAVHGGRLAFVRMGKAVTLTKDYLQGAFVSMKMGVGKIKMLAGGIQNMAGNFSAARSMGLSFFQSLKMTLSYTKLGAAATKAWTAIQSAFNAVMAANPIVLITLAIVALIAIIVVMYKKFDWFRNFIDGVFSVIKAVIGGVWDGIKAAFDIVWNAIAGAISFVWNNIIKPIFEAFGIVFSAVWSGIKAYFDFYWGLISKAISFVWNNVIKPVFNAIGTVFSKVWEGIKTAFSKAWDFITGVVSGAKQVFGKVKDAIVGAFKAAINFIIRGWNAIEFKIPGFKVGPVKFGGFTLGLPDIPELAQGGIVSPVSGGVLARIGEGGRPERIEPLDPDGLSKRDKAMIAMLAGGAGGGVTLNVYPSAGMNEVELAALVNRQLAFALRKGAA